MPTQQRAEAASEALSQEQRIAQASKHLRRSPLAGHKWAGVGALAGFSLGAVSCYLLTGHIYTAGLAGMAIGLALGAAADRRQV